MTGITATRFHDFSCGHRVVGHEGKCRHLHGHNYRVHFTIGANSLDGVGRVLDFSVIKSLLCEWVEEQWDHKTLLWENDPLLAGLAKSNMPLGLTALFDQSFVVVPFNPTAENMGAYLLMVVGPQVLEPSTEARLVKVVVEETRKCSVEVTL